MGVRKNSTATLAILRTGHLVFHIHLVCPISSVGASYARDISEKTLTSINENRN